MTSQSGGGYAGVTSRADGGLNLAGKLGVNGASPGVGDLFAVLNTATGNWDFYVDPNFTNVQGELGIVSANGNTAFDLNGLDVPANSAFDFQGKGVIHQGLGIWGHAAPAGQPTITGNVTTGTLANLQTVVGALLTALDAMGTVVKNTT